MEPITYYIYEIPGKKVGCTKNPKKRLAAQKALDNYRVLTTTSCIEEASILERRWQRILGYRLDNGLYKQATTRLDQSTLGLGCRYGTGVLYKELITGFVGKMDDHKKHFGITDNSYFAEMYLNRPKVRGRFRGMIWIKLSE